jgi:hypothetical protein
MPVANVLGKCCTCSPMCDRYTIALQLHFSLSSTSSHQCHENLAKKRGQSVRWETDTRYFTGAIGSDSRTNRWDIKIQASWKVLKQPISESRMCSMDDAWFHRSREVFDGRIELNWISNSLSRLQMRLNQALFWVTLSFVIVGTIMLLLQPQITG